MSKHDLTQANSVDLMDRVDSKFIFLASELHEILNQCMESYSLLEIMNENLFEYKNSQYNRFSSGNTCGDKSVRNR